MHDERERLAGKPASPSVVAEALDPLHWMTWFGSLEPSFVFLLSLPFVVAAAGLFADWFRNRANGPFTTTIVKH